LVKEFAALGWKKTTKMIFETFERTIVAVSISAVWFGTQRAVVDEATDENTISLQSYAIVNICRNNGCYVCSLNIVT